VFEQGKNEAEDEETVVDKVFGAAVQELKKTLAKHTADVDAVEKDFRLNSIKHLGDCKNILAQIEGMTNKLQTKIDAVQTSNLRESRKDIAKKLRKSLHREVEQLLERIECLFKELNKIPAETPAKSKKTSSKKKRETLLWKQKSQCNLEANPITICEC